LTGYFLLYLITDQDIVFWYLIHVERRVNKQKQYLCL